MNELPLPLSLLEYALPARIIARIKGGLGNQLFCYAAARRLALINGAELIIDDVSGFVRDRCYHRHYMLNHFNISVRKALPAERLEPFERYRRGVIKWLSRRKPFVSRSYIEQEGIGFDERLLRLRVTGTLYLDGLWQSEDYFKDMEKTIRDDLRFIPPKDNQNQSMSEEICSNCAVALHVRQFEEPGQSGVYNLTSSYYQHAIALMEERVRSPHYFLFTDNPDSGRDKISMPPEKVTFVLHNQGDKNDYADLWLMSQCNHFIIANSTFSWWGAWLSESKDKIVVAPDINTEGKTAWGFHGLIPPEWITISN